MSKMESLRETLVDELKDILNAEQQLIKTLPKLAAKATNRELKQAFNSHLSQTKNHAKRCEQALKLLGEKVSTETCDGMQGLLEEGEDMIADAEEGAVRDAVMIASAQKVEHYEIASYGTIRTFAQVLGEQGVQRLLEQTLNEEKDADRKLTTIAESSVNEDAARAIREHAEDESGILNRGAEWVGSTAASIAKRVMPRTHAADAARSQPATSGPKNRKKTSSSSSRRRTTQRSKKR